MYQDVRRLLETKDSTALLINNGFERRALRGAELLDKIRFRPSRVVLLKYPGQEDQKHTIKATNVAQRLAGDMATYREISCTDTGSQDAVLAELERRRDRVVCDITGLSRNLILRLLTVIYGRRLNFSLIYTEAKSYFPYQAQFRKVLRRREPSEAFIELANYEATEIVYSSECDVQEISELPGRIFPNHPVMLIAFLAFKRSRLSCILNQYETNARILIESDPVREDLKWRRKLMEIINFDLVDENRENIVKVPTLYWERTYQTLRDLYREKEAKQRYNTLLAPLGGKMQTVGAWYFAVRNPDVKVITSTPRQHFQKKYSTGYTTTHLVCMDSVYDRQD
jgi:hypothetical protein